MDRQVRNMVGGDGKKSPAISAPAPNVTLKRSDPVWLLVPRFGILLSDLAENVSPAKANAGTPSTLKKVNESMYPRFPNHRFPRDEDR
jgi:hypothetical protein